jgi:hypothetical protein
LIGVIVKGGVLAFPFFSQNSSMKIKAWQKTVFGALTLFLFGSNGMPSELSHIHTLVEESSPVFASSCPVPGALSWDMEKPSINAEACVGCSLCRQACVVNPKAVTIKSLLLQQPDSEQYEKKY